MSVYVDSYQHHFGRMKMCHMLADSLEELHEMAQLIGLKWRWFQAKSVPHYDLCQSKRKAAIQAGAVEINRVAEVALIRKWKAKAMREKG